MGMDMFAAETVLELKKEYPEILLEMVSPLDEQAAKWAPEYQKRHNALFDQADVYGKTRKKGKQTGFSAGRNRGSARRILWLFAPRCDIVLSETINTAICFSRAAQGGSA